MRPPPGADDRLQVKVVLGGAGEARVKCPRRLPPGFPGLVGLKRPLDDIGDRTVFAARQPAGEVAGAGAADGKLRFGHRRLLVPQLYANARKGARWPLMARWRTLSGVAGEG